MFMRETRLISLPRVAATAGNSALFIGRKLMVNKKLVARIVTACGLFGLPVNKAPRGFSGLSAEPS
jgi:hypothetical protein